VSPLVTGRTGGYTGDIALQEVDGQGVGQHLGIQVTGRARQIDCHLQHEPDMMEQRITGVEVGHEFNVLGRDLCGDSMHHHRWGHGGRQGHGISFPANPDQGACDPWTHAMAGAYQEHRRQVKRHGCRFSHPINGCG
jgi:hypothetical protein